MSADLIVLAAIAIFILLRLRSVLGQKIGHDQGASKMKEPLGEDSERVIQIGPKTIDNDLDETLRQALREPEKVPDSLKDSVAALRVIDPGFSLRDFLKGADVAFEMVVQAFAKDQRDTLKQLLSKDLFQQFRDALDARKRDDSYEEVTLVAVLKTEPVSVECKKNIATIVVRFESEQIRVTRGKDGKIISGDPSAIQTADDEWTFEKDMRSSNPNWTIVAT
ncbi:MAG: Tim44/TimA family putative adaptor protein [Rickettsiales bacterium]